MPFLVMGLLRYFWRVIHALPSYGTTNVFLLRVNSISSLIENNSLIWIKQLAFLKFG